MNQKENWIQETLNSVDCIKRADANEDLYDKVMQRSQKREAKIMSIKPQLVWRVAASITLLIGLNVFTLLSQHSQKENKNGESNTFATEYFSYINQI